MFDFAWSEIALIGVVALVAIGPKDMPVALKTITNLIKKARRMASEFQTQVDEMVKDTELHDVRNSINELRSVNLRTHVERAVDQDGTLRRALTEDPFKAGPSTMGPGIAIPEHPAHSIADAPAFVPPGTQQAEAPAEKPVPLSPPPAFIPPEAAEFYPARF